MNSGHRCFLTAVALRGASSGRRPSSRSNHLEPRVLQLYVPQLEDAGSTRASLTYRWRRTCARPETRDVDSQAVTVLVADDHPAYRKAIVEAIAEHPELELVAEATNGDAALLAVVHHEPDVALLDLVMPGRDGIEVCDVLTRTRPGTAVVLLSAHSGPALAVRAEAAGAADYLSKQTSRREICQRLAEIGRSRMEVR